jgi:anti-sigma regulatory factor (Ser/Thr protein kinase)
MYMELFISYNNRKYRQISFKFDVDTDFREIIKTLDHLILPNNETESRNIKNGLLELINNSLRAHRENNINKSIIISFECINSSLKMLIKDHGKGFDPEKLPYSIDKNTDEININSEDFKEYQKKNNYLRFGMGLYLVKKIFNTMQISFHDESGSTVPWDENKVSGTTITALIKVENNGT